MNTPQLILFAGAVFVSFFIFLYFVPVNIWITAIFSGVQVDLLQLVFMRIRKSPVRQIVLSKIVASKSGIPIELEKLETHALAGGDVTEVVKTLIKAKNKGIDVSLEDVAAWNLAGEGLDKKLEEKQSASTDDQLRIEILNKVKNLSEKDLKKVAEFVKTLG